LRGPPGRPVLSVRSGSGLELSSKALADLMKSVLARGLPFRFRVRGWSMSPFIRDFDVLTVVPLGSRPPRTGEIVAFVSTVDERLVVHRVVGRRGAALLVQGDNLAGATDAAIPESRVLGRVKRIERDGKTVRLGLGAERSAVAFLSRKGLLAVLAAGARALFRRGSAARA
jgi:hypothetical protein